MVPACVRSQYPKHVERTIALKESRLPPEALPAVMGGPADPVRLKIRLLPLFVDLT